MAERPEPATVEARQFARGCLQCQEEDKDAALAPLLLQPSGWLRLSFLEVDVKKASVLAVFSLALPLLLVGCGDDEEDGEDLTLALVASNWTAISVEFESDTDPLERVDVINDLNGTFIVT